MNDTPMAQVELLHLMEKHKLHMNVMIVKSQSFVDHDFSLSQHCTRDMILKDMQGHFCHPLNPNNSKTIAQDEISYVMTTVQPDHTDVGVPPGKASLETAHGGLPPAPGTPTQIIAHGGTPADPAAVDIWYTAHFDQATLGTLFYQHISQD